MVKFDQIWSNVINFDQMWSMWSNQGFWSKLITFDQIWSHLIRFHHSFMFLHFLKIIVNKSIIDTISDFDQRFLEPFVPCEIYGPLCQETSIDWSVYLFVGSCICSLLSRDKIKMANDISQRELTLCKHTFIGLSFAKRVNDWFLNNS